MSTWTEWSANPPTLELGPPVAGVLPIAATTSVPTVAGAWLGDNRSRPERRTFAASAVVN